MLAASRHPSSSHPVRRFAAAVAFSALWAVPLAAQRTPLVDHFVHWETAHVHPLEMTPDGNTLLAVNTPDARLEIFDLTGALPAHIGSVQVGIDPVSVRALDNSTAWVCNHISDSISIVDITNMHVIDTIQTGDEPSDVVFTDVIGANPARAWVSLSQPDTIEVYDRTNAQTLHATPLRIPLTGQDPRSMVLAPDGLIYVGIFTSANNTTVLNGSDTRWAPNAVDSPAGPYGNISNPPPNPPPNSGTGFSPALAPGLTTPPKVSHIVRKDSNGKWFDDNNGDWTNIVTGGQHGRAQGWDMYDHDIAVIDPATASVRGYVTRAMNIVANVAVRPVTGGFVISAVGTEATNEIRFEPNINGTFVRAHLAGALPWTQAPATPPPTALALGPFELNKHLVTGGAIPSPKPYGPYATGNQPQSVRDLAIGDPRYHVWDASGQFGFVAGMGSNNVVAIDGTGNRIPNTQPIEVGEGPTGLVLNETNGHLYVLNRFSGSLSVTGAAGVITELVFHDPTPLAVKVGRKHLFDTHKTSGLGQASCASCHFDGDFDGLGWDLGDPAGQVRAVHAPNMDGEKGLEVLVNGSPADQTQRFHPMKGPMVTQSLRDIIGKEPFHWRGDKKGVEEFNGAFVKLQGDDATLSAVEMQQLEDYLKSLWYPPNPLRNLDNTFEGATVMDGTHGELPGAVFRYHSGAGAPTTLPSGGALAAFNNTSGGHYVSMCLKCHTASTGTGPDRLWDGANWNQLSPGTYGEAHTAIVTSDGISQTPIKIAGLRNLHDRTGFDMTAQRSTRGFGYLHDGHIDTVGRFLKPFRLPVGSTNPLTPQVTADVVAFLLQFSSNITYPTVNNQILTPTGPPAQNAHPAVGLQWTVKDGNLSALDSAKLNEMFAVLQSDANNVGQGYDSRQIGMIVKQNLAGGGQRGLLYLGPDYIDENYALVPATTLLTSIGAGTEATFTIVPTKTEVRFGIDRDADGWLDGEESAVYATNPASARSIPSGGGVACPSNLPAPPAVTGVSVTALSVYGNGISWTIPGGSNHTGFAVERMLANSPQWETIAELPAATTMYTDNGASAVTQYYYRVRSYNCRAETVSATATNTTFVFPPTITPVHLHSIEVQWTKEQNGGNTQWFAYGTFHIVDDEDRAMKGVRVTAQINGPTGVQAGPNPWGLDPIVVAGAAFSTQTNGDGQAYFRSGPINPPSAPVNWTFQLNNVDTAASGSPQVAYVPGSNKVATTLTITAPIAPVK